MELLTRIFARFSEAGRREAAAKRWDETADRLAASKQNAQQAYAKAVEAGAESAWFAKSCELYATAERNARTIARGIREGK